MFVMHTKIYDIVVLGIVLSHLVWWEIVISFIIFIITGVDGVIDRIQHVWGLVFHVNIPSICMSTLTCIGVVMDAYMNV
jgi:hypothetical protein